MVVAACAVACTTVMAFADNDDDIGIVPATPLSTEIKDPVNPKEGMIFSAYGSYAWMDFMDGQQMRAALNDSFSSLPKAPAVKTGVDESDKFTIDCANGVSTGAIRWEGFLQMRKAGKYTFLVQKNLSPDGTYNWICGYAIAINGKVCTTTYGQGSFDVDLKIGYNKVEIVTLLPGNFPGVSNAPLFISMKRKGSLIEPVQLSPKCFFHDDIEVDKDPGIVFPEKK